MKKKKVKLIFHSDKFLYEIDGKFYAERYIKYKKIDGVEHEDKVIYEEVDLDKQQKQLEFIKGKLKGTVPPERVIEEVLKQIKTKDLDKIEKILRNKKPKVKRHDGCLGINIDGGKNNKAYIQLFD